MTVRITIACPENLVSDANQFALCVGYSPADARTFGRASWEDGSGERFSLASLLASEFFPTIAASSLVAPAHAPDVDLVAAQRAQQALDIWTPLSSDPVPSVGMDKLVAVVGLEASLTIPLLNLAPVPIQE